MVRPRGTDSAKVIQVIETKSIRGSGEDGDLCRCVTQYWNFDGELLAENDPCVTETVTSGSTVSTQYPDSIKRRITIC